MLRINEVFTDEEAKALKKVKNGFTWREFMLKKVKGGVGNGKSSNNTKSRNR